LETEADLAEVDYGAWDGRTLADIDAFDPENARRFRQWDPTFAFPCGESLDAFVARVGRATYKLTGRPEQCIGVVSHIGVIRQITCHMLGLSPRQHSLFEIDYAKVALLSTFGARGVLGGLNLC
jgi:broad specificity phosphatase PhoE